MERKLLAYLSITLALVPFLVSSQTKVSQLPYAAALTGTEAVPMVQTGQTVQASVNQLNAYTFGTLPFTVSASKQVIFIPATSGPTISASAATASDALQIYSTSASTRASIVFSNGTGNNDYVGMDGAQQILPDSTSGDLVFRGYTGSNIRFGFWGAGTSAIRIGPNGNVNFNAPTITTSTVNVFGVNNAWAQSIQGASGSNGSGLLVQGNYTGAGNVNLVYLTDVNNTNGVNFSMNGNGGGQSCKTLRVYLGHFNILNCAYTSTLLDLDDSGSLQIGSVNQGQGIGTVVVGKGYWNNTAPLPGAATAGGPSVSGCGSAGSVTGTTVNGSFIVGTGASPCTFTFTFPTSPLGHGWNCTVDDATNNTHLASTTGGTATTCVVKGNAATSDLIYLNSAFPF